MAGRFVGIPTIPDSGLAEWQGLLFGSIKENVELLTGTRGEPGGISEAIIRGDVTVARLGTQSMHTVTTSGVDGYTITGQDVAALDAFRNLRNDVQALANDLAETRSALDTLIAAMTSGG